MYFYVQDLQNVDQCVTTTVQILIKALRKLTHLQMTAYSHTCLSESITIFPYCFLLFFNVFPKYIANNTNIKN